MAALARTALCLALPFIAGCTGTTGHLALAATGFIDPGQLRLDTPPRHVVGRSCLQVIVLFPTNMPNFGNAIADALRQGGGQVLTDVRIGYELKYVPFVYGTACYVAEGDAR